MSFIKQFVFGAFLAVAVVLFIWSPSFITENSQNNVDISQVNSSTQPEETYNISILEKPSRFEKPSRMPVSAPDTRFVWDANAGAGSTFNLTPLNFDGFYYDLDNNAGSESFSIELGSPDNRSIKENDLKYSTTVLNIPFKYRQFGNYSMIGFMGERYFAGYTQESRIASLSANLLNHGLLLSILMDENVNRTLSTGGGMALGDGYSIWVEDVNIDEGITQFSLTKNGEEIDSRSVKAQDTYIFKKDIRMIATAGSIDYDNNITVGSLPVIAIHIDSILLEKNLHVVRIKGIFQLSDIYTKIQPGSEYWIYGIMKIMNISEKGISMSNMNSINLRYPYSTEYKLNSIGIMSGFGLKVADSEVLRFIADKESPEHRNLERRGAVYTESNPVLAWDGLNFAGFLYNLDSGNYSEMLEITNLSGRTISAHGLKYTAFVTDIPYTVTKETGIKPAETDGSYKSVGFGAEKYAAVKGKSSRPAKVLVDKTRAVENRVLLEGEIWQLGDGYSLTIKSVDASSSTRRVKIALSRNGVELDQNWISSGNAFTFYGKNSSLENDLPVFVTYFKDVFFGEANPYYIELRYTWLVSENVTEIKEGDRFGVFSVTDVEPEFIVLENNRAIDLTPGSCIDLLGNLGFIVADSDELRFYPSGGTKCD